MPKPKKHLLICVNERPADSPKGCCAGRGGNEIAAALKELCKKFGETVRVSRTKCLGRCELGANVVVYPDDVWYSGVKQADVAEIVIEHIENNRPVQRLIHPSMKS